MPLYEHTKSKRRHRTNAGSTQDKRLAASSNYRDVDAKPEVKGSDGDAGPSTSKPDQSKGGDR